MSRSAGPLRSPLSSSCQPTSSMTVFSQPGSFPHSLDERTPFPFRWCLVIRHLRHYGRERRARLATDSPLRSFFFCFRQPHLALGGGWCPGWPQATPKGPQGLDTRRSQRILSRLEARPPLLANHPRCKPAPDPASRQQPHPARSRRSAPHSASRPIPAHPLNRQGSLIGAYRPVAISGAAPIQGAAGPSAPARPWPRSKPSSGLPPSKSPTTIPTRSRVLASTPPTTIAMAAAKLDRPRDAATSRSVTIAHHLTKPGPVTA